MKSKPQGIEALTIRRAVIADADKVRYRVYSTPTEFIAVIAESALMAVKVAGIAKPHKIVRDLPTEGVAIDAQRMAARDEKLARVSMAKEQSKASAPLVAEIPAFDPAAKMAAFKPMQIGDLQRSGGIRARILPPEMLSEIIEQHAKANLPPPPTDEPSAAASPPEVESAPVSDPEAAITTEERVMRLAEEILPSAATLVNAPASTLSPEEVEKLLNG